MTSIPAAANHRNDQSAGPEPEVERAAAPRLADQVSVVLLTYNCAHRLSTVLDRLESLAVTVIAVDNGSSDDTVAVLRERGLRVAALGHNIGAAARNVGVELAPTPYVAMCDDDGWYERDGLARAANLLRQHPRLAVVNGRILVGPEQRLDPISAEMEASPLPDPGGVVGTPLLGFMAGAVVVRRSAYLEVGGYDPRFFIGGEEETLSFRLAKAGWDLRYVPDVVVHHRPSLANVTRLRSHGMRSTLWNAWLHRRLGSALRWTAFTLADRPKNRDWIVGVTMAVRGLPWVLREREPMTRELDDRLRLLDRRRFAERRPLWSRRDWQPPADPEPTEASR
ncbi:MAG: glycosyltransferase [Microlunatus sp.]|nr:glycosyltransferase [Microlunatus sp.]